MPNFTPHMICTLQKEAAAYMEKLRAAMLKYITV